MSNFKLLAVVLLFGVLLFGCLGQTNESNALASNQSLVEVPVVTDSELIENDALDVANITSDISEVDISDEELNETLG